jgi:hypothetical protein
MKGIEKYERDSKRGTNSVKVETLTKEETAKKEEKKIAGHSKKKIGSYFTDLIGRTKDWINDDIE